MMSKINTLDKNQIWKRFIINIGLVIILFLMGIFIGFLFKVDQIVENQLLTSARGHFNNIVLTRRWNANYGGVFVKKVEGVISNPYLKNPDIQTQDGIIYTKKNPALMTKEISKYAETASGFKYHITSLRPLNPNNIADDFEKNALKQFERGEKEIYLMVSDNENSLYRYMAPLYVEKGCLGCHAKQGYKTGDVRGGISVSLDISDLSQKMINNLIIFIAVSIAISLFLLGVIFFIISKFSLNLSDAYRIIEEMSVTDELMQIYNRRYFHTKLDEEILRAKRYKHHLSLLMIDIDHFKNVNDTHGHQAGDDVLIGFASLLKINTRETDIIARYGGEEIVVILPETDKSSAYIIAEKIRNEIENHSFSISDKKKLSVTASFGVSSFEMIPDNTDDKAKQIIKLADDALYTAKNKGRNRVI